MMRTAYGRDVGLTVRILFVFSLLALVYVAVALGVALLFVVKAEWWPYWAFMLVVLAITVWAHFRSPERILLRAAGAEIVGRRDAPELHRLVERLCAMADLPKPELAVSRLRAPNAFAVGLTPSRAVVVVTKSLLKRLEPAELEAVLAHELAHVAHRDAAVLTAVGSVRTLGDVIFGRGESGASYLWYVFWPVGLLLFALGTMMTLAISRYREFVADRGSALITGAPEQLMSALQKLAGDAPSIPAADLRGSLDALLIVPASAERPRWTLALDHPPLEKRLAKLAELSRKMGKAA